MNRKDPVSPYRGGISPYEKPNAAQITGRLICSNAKDLLKLAHPEKSGEPPLAIKLGMFYGLAAGVAGGMWKAIEANVAFLNGNGGTVVYKATMVASTSELYPMLGAVAGFTLGANIGFTLNCAVVGWALANNVGGMAIAKGGDAYSEARRRMQLHRKPQPWGPRR